MIRTPKEQNPETGGIRDKCDGVMSRELTREFRTNAIDIARALGAEAVLAAEAAVPGDAVQKAHAKVQADKAGEIAEKALNHSRDIASGVMPPESSSLMPHGAGPGLARILELRRAEKARRGGDIATLAMILDQYRRDLTAHIERLRDLIEDSEAELIAIYGADYVDDIYREIFGTNGEGLSDKQKYDQLSGHFLIDGNVRPEFEYHPVARRIRLEHDLNQAQATLESNDVERMAETLEALEMRSVTEAELNAGSVEAQETAYEEGDDRIDETYDAGDGAALDGGGAVAAFAGVSLSSPGGAFDQALAAQTPLERAQGTGPELPAPAAPADAVTPAFALSDQALSSGLSGAFSKAANATRNSINAPDPPDSRAGAPVPTHVLPERPAPG